MPRGFIVGDHGTLVINMPSPVTQSTIPRDELLQRVSAVNAELRGSEDLLRNLVGAWGFEPQTPTVSTRSPVTS